MQPHNFASCCWPYHDFISHHTMERNSLTLLGWVYDAQQRRRGDWRPCYLKPNPPIHCIQPVQWFTSWLNQQQSRMLLTNSNWWLFTKNIFRISWATVIWWLLRLEASIRSSSVPSNSEYSSNGIVQLIFFSALNKFAHYSSRTTRSS